MTIRVVIEGMNNIDSTVAYSAPASNMRSRVEVRLSPATPIALS